MGDGRYLLLQGSSREQAQKKKKLEDRKRTRQWITRNYHSDESPRFHSLFPDPLFLFVGPGICVHRDHPAGRPSEKLSCICTGCCVVVT